MISRQTIKSILEENSIFKYKINSDLIVDVFQDVDMTNIFEECEIQFGKVEGDFFAHNCGLTSLKGMPKIVSGDFSCSLNNLKNLIGGPTIVGGDYHCENSCLESLEGIPQNINGNLYLKNNEIVDFSYAPISVSKLIDLEHNCISTLKNIPYTEHDYINLNFNPIVDLSLKEIEHLENSLVLCFCNVDTKIEILNDFYTINNDLEITVKDIRSVLQYLKMKEDFSKEKASKNKRVKI